MATSVPLVLHGLLAGKTFTPAELRSGFLSRLAVVQDPTTPLKPRPGILPGAGTPGAVSQASTPAMKVLVKAGSFVVAAPGSPAGVYTCTLNADTELDVVTAPGSNTRWDVIAVKVFDDGTTPTASLESVAGSAAASPALPVAITSPVTNTYWLPLRRVTVASGTSAITNAMLASPAAAGGLPTFGQFTAAPGGSVRNVTRKWTHTRNTTTTFTPGAAPGVVNQVTIPAAEALPGLYEATFHANVQVSGTPGAGAALHIFRTVTPDGVFDYPVDVDAARFFTFGATRTIVIDTQPATNRIWQTTLEVASGAAFNSNVGVAACTLEVVRVSDL